MNNSTEETTKLGKVKYTIITGYDMYWAHFIMSCDYKSKTIVYADIYVSDVLNEEFKLYFESGKTLP